MRKTIILDTRRNIIAFTAGSGWQLKRNLATTHPQKININNYIVHTLIDITINDYSCPTVSSKCVIQKKKVVCPPFLKTVCQHILVGVSKAKKFSTFLQDV